jgi:microcystin-dependent protein
MTPILGMIFIFSGNFAPAGYATCDGQLLAISQNTALFSILGTFYGGNGVNNFALPDLRGRVPIHTGQGPGLSNYNTGQSGGVETNTLTVPQLPSHSHSFNLSSIAGTTGVPGTSTYLSRSPATGSGPNDQIEKFYTTTAPNTTLNAGAIGATGSGSPVNNIQPYLGITHIIALVGVFPSRN